MLCSSVHNCFDYASNIGSHYAHFHEHVTVYEISLVLLAGPLSLYIIGACSLLLFMNLGILHCTSIYA